MNRLATWLAGLVPSSIGARGAVLIGLIVTSIGLPAGLWYVHAQRRNATQAQQDVEAFLGVALAAYLESAPESVEDPDKWLGYVLNASQRVHWAGIFESSGQGLEFRRRSALPQRAVVEQIDFAAREPQIRPLQVAGTSAERFHLVTIPQADTGAVLAVVLDRGPPAASAAALAGSLMLLALAGAGVSLAWFQYAIALPIRRFSRTLANVHTGLSEAARAERPLSELAEVVRLVESTREELRQWRGEATQLRHSLAARVDAQTRHAQQAARQAEQQADTDTLTRLENRRAFDRDLSGIYERQQRLNRELAVVVLDVDQFKQLNDTHGHQAGDDLLSFLGDLLRATIRKNQDRAFRYGGDEFVLLLPDATALEACDVARRLVSLFAQRARVIDQLPTPVTLSAGVVSLRQHGAADAEHLVRMADAAMYWAKRNRRGVGTIQDAWAAGLPIGQE